MPAAHAALSMAEFPLQAGAAESKRCSLAFDPGGHAAMTATYPGQSLFREGALAEISEDAGIPSGCRAWLLSAETPLCPGSRGVNMADVRQATPR